MQSSSVRGNEPPGGAAILRRLLMEPARLMGTSKVTVPPLAMYLLFQYGSPPQIS
jgi:hypothetical protein